MDKNKTKTERIGVTLTGNTAKLMQYWADRLDRPRAWVVRFLLLNSGDLLATQDPGGLTEVV